MRFAVSAFAKLGRGLWIASGSACFLVILIVGCRDSSRSGVSVFVSGDTTGWITPCGCAANQSGGLARRATYLADLRSKGDVLYVDVGGAAGGNSDYHKM